MFEEAYSPPREEGWLRHQENAAKPPFNGADGVVAHTLVFQNALRSVTRERPPRPRLFGTGPFFGGASTPPHEEGNVPFCNSFTPS